ncbi:doxx family protein [Fulvivirgaceae bacterium BMA10]|uniref:Doxx family protein n=1 Tax=Splendidivirga corallicola TaxID=3051826 RepID=A0ABT8KUA0_9BACT|nr:doxx family protein [Fulvivirgaceae bacterium BMA10]
MELLFRNRITNRKSLLRISIGIIYLWFGILKLFPHVSPAEDLAKDTISLLTFGEISGTISYTILAIWETAIGILLLFNRYLRITIIAALAHMSGTFAPLFILSETTFHELPTSLTLVGQYIMKNLVIVSALITIIPQRKSTKKGSSIL